MKISYSWLRDYLPVDIRPDEIAEILTNIGLEVEDLYQWESVRGGLKGLVIGEVKEVVKHPNADKLSLTKVTIGNGDLLSIVCGAPNVAAGQRVIVAPVNTTIHPVSGEPFTIRTAKIRGEESQGMICAEDEIGLGTEHAGILVLNADAPVGGNAAEYLKVVSDHVFDIAVTPNRSDAMSHIGVARDLAAYLSFHRGERVQLSFPNHDNFTEGKSKPIDVVVEDAVACPRYSGLTMDNVSVTSSPAWMQNRLKAIDVRPINNVVDITNYVLHEMGQPLHAFDADEIRGSKVIVKSLANETRFITLDEQERKLSSEDLMICDTEGGMCIAGVFGGVRSGVSEKTKRIFLESAHFNPVAVRRTSFRHNLRTEAAMRFEKGTDPDITVAALQRAARLLRQTSDAVTFSAIVDVYPSPIEPGKVKATYHSMDRLIGAEISEESAAPILEALGMSVTKSSDAIMVEVPTRKRDIAHSADLTEEVLRIYGMNRIEVSDRFLTAISPQHDNRHKLREVAGDWLAANGFSEMQSLSMTNAEYYTEAEQPDLAILINPLSSELEVMRSSMLYSCLEHVARNLSHRSLDLKLFEFGKVYRREGEAFIEEEKLAILMTGSSTPETWEYQRQPVSFFNMKAIVERVVEVLGITPVSAEDTPFRLWRDSPLAVIPLPNAQAIARGRQDFSQSLVLTITDREVAALGEVSSRTLKRFDIKQPVYYADINWSVCSELALRVEKKFQPLAKLPSIRRDLAIVIDEGISYAEVHRAATSRASGLLREVKLFDTYRDEKIGKGKKSYAMSFTFRDDARTLTDDEADKAISKVIASLEKELNATIRTA